MGNPHLFSSWYSPVPSTLKYSPTFLLVFGNKHHDAKNVLRTRRRPDAEKSCAGRSPHPDCHDTHVVYHDPTRWPDPVSPARPFASHRLRDRVKYRRLATMERLLMEIKRA